MKSSNTSTVWPDSLAQYKAFFDANPKYARIPEKEKIEIARHFMSSTYADPTNDWAFKWAFSNSPEDLRMLLVDILDEPIDTISIGAGDALAGTPSDKQATLDILCTTTDERQFIVEMQTTRKPDFRNRMFYYGAAAIHRQVKTGSKAYDYEPVRVVAILDYVTRHGQVPKGKALFQYMLLEKETAEQFGNQIRLYMLELPRAILSPDKNKVEEWCYFFKNLPNFVGVPQDINPRFYRIMDKLRIDKMTDAERTEY
ncbi:MAG: Rpn family recombination-promoting nuclease/putative transposase, partial [Bacteroidales bacterium]|nr:Rpn family recombination-promoting nuclease/putative transposase [Bacteroidales bacterium]